MAAPDPKRPARQRTAGPHRREGALCPQRVQRIDALLSTWFDREPTMRLAPFATARVRDDESRAWARPGSRKAPLARVPRATGRACRRRRTRKR